MLVLAAFATMASSACSEGAGEVSRDTRPFDEIDAQAKITMTGTEPFWTMRIEPGSDGLIARYSAPDAPRTEVFAVTRFAGNNGLGFSGAIEEGIVQAALSPGACDDGMTDRTYPYIATIAMGDQTLYGCGYTDDEVFAGDRSP